MVFASLKTAGMELRGAIVRLSHGELGANPVETEELRHCPTKQPPYSLGAI